MFQLNQTEFRNLKSQIVISSWGGARRGRPYAFTEQGAAMLSFKVVFDAIREPMAPSPLPTRRQIGFGTLEDDASSQEDG